MRIMLNFWTSIPEQNIYFIYFILFILLILQHMQSNDNNRVIR